MVPYGRVITFCSTNFISLLFIRQVQNKHADITKKLLCITINTVIVHMKHYAMININLPNVIYCMFVLHTIRYESWITLVNHDAVTKTFD